MATEDKSGEDPLPEQNDVPGEDRAAIIAGGALQPSMQAAVTLQTYSTAYGDQTQAHQ